MKLLLATDGSKHAQAAEQLLDRLPLRGSHEVVAVHVQTPMPKATPEDNTHRAQEAQEILSGVVGRLTAPESVIHRWPVETAVREGHVAKELIAAGAELSADLVVAGAKGQSGLTEFLLGSVSEKLARHAPNSVLIAREFGPQTPLRVLVALDGTEASLGVLPALKKLELGAGAQIHVVTVVTVVKLFGIDFLEHNSRPWLQARARAKRAVEDNAEMLQELYPEAEVTPHLLEAENVAEVLVDFLRRHEIKLAIVGSHGKSRLERVLLGSVSENLLRHAPCSVWIARSPVSVG